MAMPTLSRRSCLRHACKHCDRMESLEGAQEDQPLPSAALRQAAIVPEGEGLSIRAVSMENDVLDKVEGWGPEEFRRAQNNDKNWKPVMHWMERGNDRPQWQEVAPNSTEVKAYWAQWQSLQLCDGQLLRLWESPTGDKTTKQVVLPEPLLRKVLHQLHGVHTAEHFAVAKARVRERFHWASCPEEGPTQES